MFVVEALRLRVYQKLSAALCTFELLGYFGVSNGRLSIRRQWRLFCFVQPPPPLFFWRLRLRVSNFDGCVTSKIFLKVSVMRSLSRTDSPYGRPIGSGSSFSMIIPGNIFLLFLQGPRAGSVLPTPPTLILCYRPDSRFVKKGLTL